MPQSVAAWYELSAIDASLQVLGYRYELLPI